MWLSQTAGPNLVWMHHMRRFLTRSLLVYSVLSSSTRPPPMAPPTCAQVPEICSRVLFCSNEWQIYDMRQSINLLSSCKVGKLNQQWMSSLWHEAVHQPPLKVEVEPVEPWPPRCIVEYAKGRVTIIYHYVGYLPRHGLLVPADGTWSGWNLLVSIEGGNVSKSLWEIQTTYSVVARTNLFPRWWATRLVIKPLETTHSQWLYQCIQAHNSVQGTQAILWNRRWGMTICLRKINTQRMSI